jgi:hypothetical protein
MTATTLLFADNASTVLASSITAAATTCTLAPGTGALFPNPGANQAFPMSFVDAATGLLTEIVLVTARSGDTITTMVRGQEGTAARAWLAADLANCFWTAGALGAGAMAQIGPLQQGTYGYAVDSGSANAIVLTMTPAITSYVDGFPINFKAAANNTGATTININGVGAVALQGAAGALQGGEIVAGKTYEGNYNATSSTFVLLGQGGGAEQIAPATASQHAVQFGQVAGVVGSVRNLKMYVSAASATATLTADEIVVETALGGLRYCLPNFSKTINLGTTGAGGLDTGTAASAYVAVYAIYNPTTSTPALLATVATSAVAPSVYGGANMPAGYTASALLAVVVTNASAQFKPVLVRDRRHSIISTSALATSTSGTNVTLSLAPAIPPNATHILGELVLSNTASSAMSLNVVADSNGLGQQNVTLTPGTSLVGSFAMGLVTPQQLIYTASSSAGTPTYSIFISEYDI